MHISHLKAVGIRNWGSVGRAIERIRDAVERGVDVTCDAYPYTAGSTTILSLMPPWAMEGGVDALLNRLADETTYARIRKDLLAPGDTWDNVAFLIGFDRIVLTSSTAPELAGFVGKSFANAAESLDLDAVDGYLRLVALGHGDGTIVVHHMHADDVREVLTFERTLVGSDGLPTIGGHPHPRLYGTFARYLGHYVRDEGILPFSEAVRRLTSASVDRFHLGTKRGRIDEGCAADVVILDVARLRDNATYESPREFADGVEAVLVAGEVVFSRGTATDKRPGSVLCRA